MKNYSEVRKKKSCFLADFVLANIKSQTGATNVKVIISWDCSEKGIWAWFYLDKEWNGVKSSDDNSVVDIPGQDVQSSCAPFNYFLHTHTLL